jgi:DNA-binding transcriptional MerR regulator
MAETENKVELPPIPAKRYFTIGEVSELCAVKPHVLRYWEQEFTQLRPVKRRGNRRYYQHHEVLLVRRIRSLLYEHGFTISGARQRLSEGGMAENSPAPESMLDSGQPTWHEVRLELNAILDELRDIDSLEAKPTLLWHD